MDSDVPALGAGEVAVVSRGADVGVASVEENSRLDIFGWDLLVRDMTRYALEAVVADDPVFKESVSGFVSDVGISKLELLEDQWLLGLVTLVVVIGIPGVEVVLDQLATVDLVRSDIVELWGPALGVHDVV